MKRRVVPGETLSGILQVMGNPNFASPSEWAKVQTRSGNPNLIYPGEELELPEVPARQDLSQLNQEMTPIIEQQINAPPNTTGGPETNFMKLIQKYFPQQEWQRAYNVMMGESGGNPSAVGDEYPIEGVYAPSYGLFQIRGLKGRPPKEQLLDPEFNVRYAAQLWQQENWRPWTVARELGYAG